MPLAKRRRLNLISQQGHHLQLPHGIETLDKTPERTETDSPTTEIDFTSATSTPKPSRYKNETEHGRSSFVQHEEQEFSKTYTPAEERVICFGMLSNIVVQGKKGFCTSGVTQYASVALRGSDVCSATDDAYVGSINDRMAQILNELRSQDGCRLQFFCRYVLLDAEHDTRSSRSKPSLVMCGIIYGPRELYEDMGDFLQRCNLYLQDPIHCELNVLYDNPHRLFQINETPTKTFDLHCETSSTSEAYENPVDLLTDLETSELLPETATPKTLKTGLKLHQKQALNFMKRRERGWALDAPGTDVWHLEKDIHGIDVYVNNITDEKAYSKPPDCRGGILGDVMGLGKTLSAIALIASDRECSLLTNSHSTDQPFVRATLVVVRTTLIKTWIDQLREHVREDAMRWHTHHGTRKLRCIDDINDLDIVITSYHTVLAESKARGPGILSTVHWHRIVLDEAHDIRDPGGVICKAVCALHATCRWALTATPIQNRLLDLASLLNFLGICPTNTFKSIMKQLVRTHGQDSATQRLRQMIRYVMLRRSLATVSLPHRDDRVVRLDFNAEEASIYQTLREKALSSSSNGSDLIKLFGQLRMVCNAGCLFRWESDGLSHVGAWDENAAQGRFDGLISAGAAYCSACNSDLSMSASEAADHGDTNDAGRPSLFSCGHILCAACIAKPRTPQCPHSTAHVPYFVSTLSSSTQPVVNTTVTNRDKSTKINAILGDIHAHIAEEKCIVFSCWTTTLDLIEHGLRERSTPYIRYDGRSSQVKRAKDLDQFSSDPGTRVALLTISCGAVGLNLTAASRAILCEPHWNPSMEQQALARIHRMGQKRAITTVRYIMRNTIEDHVVQTQHRKIALSHWLLSESIKTDEHTKHLLSLIE